ncbi:MAG: hypothetical protein IT459_07585 [Planctomycetes bacterium]|nr:hypothetical protein [Planctomycetota bacterium]
MRGAASILAFFAGLAGCATPCPTEAQLETPQQTIATFRDALACDSAVNVEYRCLSDDVKDRFGGFQGYQIGRAILLHDNPQLMLLLRVVDLDARTKVTVLPDGVHAIARISDGDQVFELLLHNEPEYVLHLANGQVLRGFATDVDVERTADDEVTIRVVDDALKTTLPASAELKRRVDLRPRWVIAEMPRLVDAIERARNGRDPRKLQE